MGNLGSISTFNINGNELTLKDPVLTNIVSQIVEAIGANNNNIAERINDLHSRSFDYTIKISSNNDSELANIQDGIYKIQYVTITSEDDNTVETLTNSAILIQTGINQYCYKDGQLSSRTKTNNTWSEWLSLNWLPSVTSPDNGKILMVVNGQWQLVSPSTLYSGSGNPNNSQGNNGDLYIQV